MLTTPRILAAALLSVGLTGCAGEPEELDCRYGEVEENGEVRCLSAEDRLSQMNEREQARLQGYEDRARAAEERRANTYNRLAEKPEVERADLSGTDAGLMESRLGKPVSSFRNGVPIHSHIMGDSGKLVVRSDIRPSLGSYLLYGHKDGVVVSVCANMPFSSYAEEEDFIEQSSIKDPYASITINGNLVKIEDNQDRNEHALAVVDESVTDDVPTFDNLCSVNSFNSGF